MVSTPLRNISPLGLLFPIYGKIKNVPNHQPASICAGVETWYTVYDFPCHIGNPCNGYIYIYIYPYENGFTIHKHRYTSIQSNFDALHVVIHAHYLPLALVAGNNKPPIWEWFIPSTYGELGDGLLTLNIFQFMMSNNDLCEGNVENQSPAWHPKGWPHISRAARLLIGGIVKVFFVEFLYCIVCFCFHQACDQTIIFELINLHFQQYNPTETCVVSEKSYVFNFWLGTILIFSIQNVATGEKWQQPQEKLGNLVWGPYKPWWV